MDIPHRLDRLESLAEQILVMLEASSDHRLAEAVLHLANHVHDTDKSIHRQNEFLAVLASHFVTLISKVNTMSVTTDALATAQDRNTASIDALPARIKAEIDAAVAAVSSPDVIADAAALPGAVALINASSDKIDAIAVPA